MDVVAAAAEADVDVDAVDVGIVDVVGTAVVDTGVYSVDEAEAVIGDEVEAVDAADADVDVDVDFVSLEGVVVVDARTLPGDKAGLAPHAQLVHAYIVAEEVEVHGKHGVEVEVDADADAEDRVPDDMPSPAVLAGVEARRRMGQGVRLDAGWKGIDRRRGEYGGGGWVVLVASQVVAVVEGAVGGELVVGEMIAGLLAVSSDRG